MADIEYWAEIIPNSNFFKEPYTIIIYGINEGRNVKFETAQTRWGARRIAKRLLKYYRSGKHAHDNRKEVIR